MIEIKATDDGRILFRISRDEPTGFRAIEERLPVEAAEHAQLALFQAIVAAKEKRS
jgi:hypothetical protein